MPVLDLAGLCLCWCSSEAEGPARGTHGNPVKSNCVCVRACVCVYVCIEWGEPAVMLHLQRQAFVIPWRTITWTIRGGNHVVMK